MIDIILTDLRVDSILKIVRELKDQGLVQGQDFDFAYTPERLDMNLASFGEIISMRKTRFTFYTESLATWFGIKYADYAA
jgi:hypothetical protein